MSRIKLEHARGVNDDPRRPNNNNSHLQHSKDGRPKDLDALPELINLSRSRPDNQAGENSPNSK